MIGNKQKGRISSKNGDRNKADFTALPMAEISMILRTLGRGLLEAVLNGEERPDISQFISHQDILVLAKSNIWKTPMLRRWLLPRQIGDGSRIFSGLIFTAWSGRMSSKSWRIKSRDYVTRSLGAGAHHILPDSFWTLAGQAAWDDLAFQLCAANATLRQLQREPLGFSGHVPNIAFSPNVFYALIILATDTEPFSMVLSGQRARVRVTRRIRQAADGQLDQDGWAGFWDQWLLARALKLWPQAGWKLGPRTRRILTRVPLLKDVQWFEPEPSLWRQLRQYPFKRQVLALLDGMPTLPGLIKSGGPVTEATAPEWRDQIPMSMRGHYPED